MLVFLHAAGAEFSGRSTEPKLECPMPDLTKGPSMVNTFVGVEDKEEEGYVNLVVGEDYAPEGEGWRTLDGSWLEIKEEINMVVGMGEPRNRKILPPGLAEKEEFATLGLR